MKWYLTYCGFGAGVGMLASAYSGGSLLWGAACGVLIGYAFGFAERDS